MYSRVFFAVALVFLLGMGMSVVADSNPTVDTEYGISAGNGYETNFKLPVEILPSSGTTTAVFGSKRISGSDLYAEGYINIPARRTRSFLEQDFVRSTAILTVGCQGENRGINMQSDISYLYASTEGFDRDWLSGHFSSTSKVVLQSQIGYREYFADSPDDYAYMEPYVFFMADIPLPQDLLPAHHLLSPGVGMVVGAGSLKHDFELDFTFTNNHVQGAVSGTHKNCTVQIKGWILKKENTAGASLNVIFKR